MFTTDPTIVDLKIKERNLYKAIFSMNFHQVATPELGVDEARCYIFFFREGDKLSAYIELYMHNTGRQLYYAYSSNPFPEVDLPMVEDDARAFGEEMGFFLDEKSFASSSAAEKNLWIDEQPIFGFKTPEQHADAVPTIETTAEQAAEKTPTPPVAAVDKIASTIPEEPAPPVAQPIPAAPIYQQAPSQPVPTMPPAAPVYYQPAPAAPTAQPTPAAPTYYQPAPAAPTAQPTPAAPVYYQPAPTAPAVPQTPPQPIYHKEIEIEPQVDVEVEDVEVEVEADVRPPRQKSSAGARSSTEKVKAAGAAPRTARPVQANPPEEEPRAAQKSPAPKQPVKKETRGAPGVVNREMEALARLMASF